jgi:hypothetical protein
MLSKELDTCIYNVFILQLRVVTQVNFAVVMVPALTNFFAVIACRIVRTALMKTPVVNTILSWSVILKTVGPTIYLSEFPSLGSTSFPNPCLSPSSLTPPSLPLPILPLFLPSLIFIPSPTILFYPSLPDPSPSVTGVRGYNPGKFVGIADACEFLRILETKTNSLIYLVSCL